MFAGFYVLVNAEENASIEMLKGASHFLQTFQLMGSRIDFLLKWKKSFVTTKQSLFNIPKTCKMSQVI